MQNILTLKRLSWTAEEQTFLRLTEKYLNESDWRPTTNWAFDEGSQEYYFSFENGRRNSEVMFSRAELLAEFGRSDLSDGAQKKLDDAMGLRDRR